MLDYRPLERYILASTSMWAMVGHVLGLGDRHGDNIMIHGLTGALFGSKLVAAQHWLLLQRKAASNTR
jgi:hypothetical protein